MGWRFRRSKQIAPGVRLNFSRRGLGISAGPRGLKLSRGADGRLRRTVSIPGTGLYNTSVLSSRKQRSPMPTQHPFPPSADEPTPSTDADSTGLRAWARRHPKTSAVGGVLAALLVLGSFGDDNDGPPATDAAVAQVAVDRDAADQAERDAAEQRAADEEAARKAAEAEAERQAAEAARVEAERVAAEKAAAEAAAAQAAAAEAARVEAARVEAEQRAAAEEAARAEAQRQAAAQAAAAPPAGGTDPRFGTCKEAKANGYGSYRQGLDVEYDWYRDADSDGIVCE